jgi:hypothetical protein
MDFYLPPGRQMRHLGKKDLVLRNNHNCTYGKSSMNISRIFQAMPLLFCCHSRVGGDPEKYWKYWIPAFAGMTSLLQDVLSFISAFLSRESRFSLSQKDNRFPITTTGMTTLTSFSVFYVNGFMYNTILGSFALTRSWWYRTICFFTTTDQVTGPSILSYRVIKVRHIPANPMNHKCSLTTWIYQ